MVLGELQFGHMTSVSSGNGWDGVSCFWKKCPAVVPCATADEESGSKLKLGSCVDQPHRVTKDLFSEKPCFKINPCIKISFPQIKL